MTNTATLNTSNKNTINYAGEKNDLKTKRKLIPGRERERAGGRGGMKASGGLGWEEGGRERRDTYE